MLTDLIDHGLVLDDTVRSNDDNSEDVGYHLSADGSRSASNGGNAQGGD